MHQNPEHPPTHLPVQPTTFALAGAQIPAWCASARDRGTVVRKSTHALNASLVDQKGESFQQWVGNFTEAIVCYSDMKCMSDPQFFRFGQDKG